ncbi:MAG: M48 family metallopeptidase [Gammaproteobacteria bacterium]|nr:M48 family metallopeptidase [Gammaproteobacteria bacterium]
MLQPLIQKKGGLPPYSVRISNRAKYLQLKISAHHQVEVVVPKGVALHHVSDFVEQHKQWIEKTLVRIKSHQPDKIELPYQVLLNAIDEQWQIQYDSTEHSNVQVDIDHNQLTVRGITETEQLTVLRAWLTQHAKTCLIPWLTAVSEELLLPFKKASVRAQKTRWGSCSSKRHISLNRALLFMSPAAVRYLFIHELCHTKHLNHSTNFWRLVAKYEPGHKAHETELRRASQVIPLWAS